MPQFKEEIELRQIKKGIKAVVLGTCMMFTFVSVTAFATEMGETAVPEDVEQEITVITEEGDSDNQDSEKIVLKMDENDVNVEIVFDESESLIYTGNPIEPKIEVYLLEESNSDEEVNDESGAGSDGEADLVVAAEEEESTEEEIVVKKGVL